MIQKTFEDLFNSNIRGGRILIDEDPQCNCDFLIVEMVKCFKKNLILFNNTKEHFSQIFDNMNIEFNTQNTPLLRSVYDIDQSDEKSFQNLMKECFEDVENFIADDVWTQRNVFKDNTRFTIGVFRSGTAIQSDYYDYDVIVKISKLKSGWSSQIDGTIRVFSRNVVYSEAKYKVTDFEIKYFSFD